MPRRSFVPFGPVVATSAQLNALARGKIAKSNPLVDQIGSIGGDEVDILAVTGVDVGTNREVTVRASVLISNDDGGSHATLRLYQGGEILNRMVYALSPVANQEVGCAISGPAIGSSGVYTFRCTVERSHGSGNLTVEGSTFAPGLLDVVDEGLLF